MPEKSSLYDKICAAGVKRDDQWKLTIDLRNKANKTPYGTMAWGWGEGATPENVKGWLEERHKTVGLESCDGWDPAKLIDDIR